MAVEINVKKLHELYEIEKERQLAMKELSEQLGYDISFSDKEVMENALQSYNRYINKTIEQEVLSLMKSLFL
jgi:hypothetical protein|tara:strand:+ start:274 stop:489 length:216 start_codon:yes stop_codon:yes gene_type:complete